MIKEEKEITYEDQYSVHLFLRDASDRRPLVSISRLSIQSFDPSPSVAIILISRGFYRIALEVGYVVAGDPQIPCVAINPTPFPTTSQLSNNKPSLQRTTQGWAGSRTWDKEWERFVEKPNMGL